MAKKNIMTMKAFTEIPDNTINSKSIQVSDSSAEADASHRLSHRKNSSYRELAAISPVPVTYCSRDEFVTHLFGNQASSVLVVNDPNHMRLEPITEVRGDIEYFLPILPPKKGLWTRSSFVNLLDVLKDVRYKYAVFEIETDEMAEGFVSGVECESYPCAAVISISPSIAHMVCRVDATTTEHYQDCCEAIIQVANDIMDCSRSATQVTYCSMPTPEKGNLLYLNPEAQWHTPVYSQYGTFSLP
jgi:hypothetical protein